jgi:site-specific recombinase XerD
MGKKQRDCVDCGAPVGYLDRQHCCLCMRRIREAAAKAQCPGCGKDRVLVEATGRCVLCSRRCSACGGPVRAKDDTVCRPCIRRAEREAAKAQCPRCGKPGLLRENTGWCGPCSRPRPAKDPPRICAACGELRRHAAFGMCSRCWQRHPDRPYVRAENLILRLPEPPPWLTDFVAYLAARHCVARACTMVSTLGRLLDDEHPNHPQAVLERARRPGRSMGSLARALEDFFAEHHLALPTDQADRLAAGRRQRRIDATPASLRPAVEAFGVSMLQARERARRAGTRPRTDHTIEKALAAMRDLARFLEAERGKQDWALVGVNDVEAFLAVLPKARKRRLTVIRQFFRFARNHRILLVDPTKDLAAKTARGFTGRTLTLDQQRALFRRWTGDPAAHPHEALLGILALLHGASSREVRLLRCEDIDPTEKTIRLGQRPQPVPLDPVSWAVLQRCLAHREAQRTDNPHVVVTRGTKAGRKPASTAYFSHLLDQCEIPPRALRGTRLVSLVNTMDPKLVAAAFGMNPQGVLPYLADYVDADRLVPNTAPHRGNL